MSYIEYKFNEARSTNRSVYVLSAVFALLFLTTGVNNFLINGHGWINAIIAVLYFIFHKTLDDKSPRNNLFTLVLFGVILTAEFLYFGTPNNVTEIGTSAKGAFFDIFASTIPFVYVGLRLLMLIPLFELYRVSRKL